MNHYDFGFIKAHIYLGTYVMPAVFFLKKNFMTPFFMDGVQLPQGYSHLLQGGSLLFTIQFPEIPTHFIDLGRMKGRVDLGATQRF